MIQVEDKIISLDIFEKHFVCDLNACKGAFMYRRRWDTFIRGRREFWKMFMKK